MRIEDDGSITVRQSWLGDFIMDPERTRLHTLHPELDGDTDVAALGTGVHAAIEAYLTEQISLVDMPEFARVSAQQQLDTSEIRWLDLTPSSFVEHAGYLADAWGHSLSPLVPKGGKCEVEFEIPTHATVVDGDNVLRDLYFKGTIDYIPPDPARQGFWDWKTAGREYKQWEKQRWAVQPSVYACAISHEYEIDLPLDFHYGVMLRKERQKDSVSYACPSGAQRVTLRRFDSHRTWVIEQAVRAVDFCLRNPIDRPWPAIDSHNLCSPKWCPWWDMCKGAHITQPHFTWKG